MSTETRAYLREIRAAKQAARRQERAMSVGRQVVEEWNTSAAVGTPVTVVLDDGSTMDTRTRSAAWTLGHGEAVVLVDGITGCYLLSRLRVRPADLKPAPTEATP